MHNVLFTNVYVKEYNFRNNCRQKARNIEPTHALFKEVFDRATIEGIAADEIKNGLNELFINGEIEVGTTINDKYIKIK